MAQGPPELDQGVQEAVLAVRAGNRQAYATIVARFQTFLMTLSMALLHDRLAAEELAQDVLVRAYQRLEEFDITRPMKPWLAKIAYRLAQERWRQAKREASRRKVASSPIPSRQSPDPVAWSIDAERAAMLWRAVQALPLAQRTAVVLYYRENMAVSEVARAMEISPGSVKTHLFRARTQIQRELMALGFDKGDLQ